MLPSKPVKKFGLGLRVKSDQNKSFNWLEWACPVTFATREELDKYISENPNWNKHRNQNNPTIKNKYCGPMELTQEEMEWWNGAVP